MLLPGTFPGCLLYDPKIVSFLDFPMTSLFKLKNDSAEDYKNIQRTKRYVNPEPTAIIVF